MELGSKYSACLSLVRLLIEIGARSLAANAAMISGVVDLSYLGVYELWNETFSAFI